MEISKFNKEKWFSFNGYYIALFLILLMVVALSGCGAERNTYTHDNGDFPGMGDWK